MKSTSISCALLLLATLSLAPGCSPAPAHAEGSAPAPVDELEPVTVTLFGERVLLFMEHPPLVRGEPARFLAHLSVLATGEPVRAGRVTLSIGATTLVAEQAKRAGLFIPEGSVDASGRLPAKLTVASAQAEEALDLGEIVVHASAAEAARAAQSATAEEPSGAVQFLMEQQWKINLLLAQAGPRSLARRLIVPAQLRAPEGAEAAVLPPLAGRLLAPESGRLPRSGDTLEAGQLVGFIEPLLGAAELAQIQALQLEFDLRSLDVVRAASEAGARLAFAQREHERVAKLSEHGLSTAHELDAAERNLALARSEDEGARTTKAALDRMRSARGEHAGGGSALRFAILAPLGGTVIAAQRIPGEIVGAGDEILRIRDTSRVWVEGRVSEFELHQVGASSSAVVTLAALPGRRIDVPADNGLRTLPTIDTQSRTALLRCEIQNDDGALLSGMLAELELATANVEAAIVLPFESIVMDQGFPTAYVMLEGELFQKRDLELGVKDGAFVEVKRGIAAGERVATRGAHLVKLAAMSPAAFGEGHQH